MRISSQRANDVFGISTATVVRYRGRSAMLASMSKYGSPSANESGVAAAAKNHV
jgi:hypothetical protein